MRLRQRACGKGFLAALGMTDRLPVELARPNKDHVIPSVERGIRGWAGRTSAATTARLWKGFIAALGMTDRLLVELARPNKEHVIPSVERGIRGWAGRTSAATTRAHVEGIPLSSE